MGIMSLFHKINPDEIYKEIANKIVLASLAYRREIDESNPQLTAYAGAEIAYLLLHLVDRAAFQVLGPARRDNIFDAIAKIVIDDYARAILRPTTPTEKIVSTGRRMLKDMNDRQSVYAACDSLTGEFGSHRGTMVFACGYFIHRALKRTSRTDVQDILCGQRNIEKSELGDFPGLEDDLKLNIYIVAHATELRLEDVLKKLK